jgi:cation diffusion facilitator CzcD-associated flavoprotein CzcO
VVVVGAGFGGIGAVIRLRQAGIHDVVVLEKITDVGGVWRDNTYPGAACDVKSHLYSFSFAPKHDWSRTYAPQPEILAYLRDVARRHGVYEHCRFGVEVAAARWDDHALRWEVTTTAGEQLASRVLISAVGQLSRPAVPAVPGLDDFAGEWFHSARWRHDLDLTGRHVAVIGSGATAIQVVPAIAEDAARVAVFQRSAPWILPKGDHPYGPAARAAFAHVPGTQWLHREWIFWTNELRVFAFESSESLLGRATEALARRHLRRGVTDPRLRARLVPDYPIGCKRVLVSNDWYPTLDRPDVEVVAAGIDRIEPAGIRTRDGRFLACDTIVFATGFRATEFLVPMQVTGRGGRTLEEAWADGAEAHLGIAVAGFPNLFLLYGPNTNLGHNSIVAMIEAQLDYVTSALTTMRRRGFAAVAVRPEVQAVSNAALQNRIRDSVWNAGCDSWYKTASGKITNNWPGTAHAYRRATRRFDPDEFLVTPGIVSRPATPTGIPA